MTVYDQVGSEYDALRGQVGAQEVLDQVRELGNAPAVLDLGCGSGHPIAMKVAPRAGRYLGIDNSRAMLEVFKKNVPGVECRLLDIGQIAQAGGGWDLIFSWGAVCHCPDEEQKRVFATVSGMLNKGGRLMFTGGRESGHVTGKVGEHTVHHYSLGEAAYHKHMLEHDLKLLKAFFTKGENFIYLYEK